MERPDPAFLGALDRAMWSGTVFAQEGLRPSALTEGAWPVATEGVYIPENPAQDQRFDSASLLHSIPQCQDSSGLRVATGRAT